MKVQELRIGNWVFCNKSYINKPVRITGISVVDRRDDHTGIYEEFVYLNEHDLLKDTEFNDQWINYKQGVLNPEDITPIPLTEQILLDCGFVKDVSSIDGQVFWHDSRKVLQGSIESFSWQNKPEYLHQLQNLYFALTGEELTYQPRPI